MPVLHLCNDHGPQQWAARVVWHPVTDNIFDLYLYLLFSATNVHTASYLGGQKISPLIAANDKQVLFEMFFDNMLY